MDLTLGKNHCPNYVQEQKQLNLPHTHAHMHTPTTLEVLEELNFFRLKFWSSGPQIFGAPGAGILEDNFSMDCRHREHNLGMIKVHSTYCVLFFY